MIFGLSGWVSAKHFKLIPKGTRTKASHLPPQVTEVHENSCTPSAFELNQLHVDWGVLATQFGQFSLEV